jgi:hypothetical protein
MAFLSWFDTVHPCGIFRKNVDVFSWNSLRLLKRRADISRCAGDLQRTALHVAAEKYGAQVHLIVSRGLYPHVTNIMNHEYGAGIILKALHQLVLKYSYHLWGCTSLGCFMRGAGLSPHYTLVTLHPGKIYKLRDVVWCSTRQHYAIVTVVPGFRNVMLLQSSVLQPCVVVQFHTMQSKAMYLIICLCCLGCAWRIVCMHM